MYTKPKWLSEKQKENTFATNKGWVLRSDSGSEELLVSIADLKNKLDSEKSADVIVATEDVAISDVKEDNIVDDETEKEEPLPETVYVQEVKKPKSQKK